jgi:hypothetical protein
MRLELIQQVIRNTFGPPRITLKMIEDALRNVIKDDPEKLECAVGKLYGVAFAKREAQYDAVQSQRQAVEMPR